MRYDTKTIDGLIAFMYSVEPNRALEFDLQWQEILKVEEAQEAGNINQKGRRDPQAVFARRCRL
jgi:hypothetical protein